jgi:Cu/Ag efflux protein CusF
MNRHALLILTVALVLPGAVWAADEHAAHDHHAMSMAGQAEVAWVDGTVKKVDKAAAMVTLAHGALDNLGMPAMTMVFRVKDAAWLGQMKEGDRIRFVADYVKGAVTVVRYEPAR